MSNRSIWSLLTAAAAVSAGNGVVFALLAEVQRVHGFETSALGWISGAFFASSLVGLLTLAHVAGQLLAAQITGTPWPLERSLAEAMDPARWWVRAKRRGSST